MRQLSFFILLGILACTSRHNSTFTRLDLSNKNLTVIPDSVFSLEKLEYLQLGNRFTLYPPLSSLGIDTLDNMNKITTISNDIIKLRHLRTLGLCFNDLRSLPTEIIYLDKLDTLDISFNQNLKIAAEFGILKQMPSLKYLNIMATSVDDSTIDKLRLALPKTKIDAKFENIRIDNIETPE